MFGFTFPALPWADHWNVVFLGAAFLVMQLFLCTRFWRRMKRCHRRLSKLLRDLESGGDGRDITSHAGELPWLRWVHASFPRRSGTPSTFTRDDVLRELDTQIAADGSYLLLQRAGAMAPLLGVIVTVLGFLLIDFSPAGDQNLDELVWLVAPLAVGVGTGALLAFINQWLLHLVGGQVEQVRFTARAWFDQAIWNHVGADTQAATVKAIEAMERMARTVHEAADRESENIQAMRDGTASIRQAAAEFQETHAALHEQFREMPARFAEMTAALEFALDTLDALIPVGQRATTGLDAAVEAFRGAAEERFAPAAKTHHAAVETLADSIARINESTLQLRFSSGELQDTVNAHANAFKGLNRSLVHQVLPAHEAFLAVLSQFNSRVEGHVERMDRVHDEVLRSLEHFTGSARQLADFLALGLNPVTQRLTQIDQTFQSLEQAVAAIRELSAARGDIEHLAHALAQAATIAEAISSLPAQVRGILEQSVAPRTGLAAWFRRPWGL